jgi:cell division protein FtsN
MPKDFFQEVDDDGGTKGSIRQGILIVLLLLTAALGYLYFFTGLIKPREQITAVPPAKVAPVKQPLPPRPDQGGMEQQTAAKPEDKQPGPATALKTAAPPASPETKPAVAPAPKTTVAPAPKTTVAPAPKTAVAPTPKPAVAPAPKTAVAPVPKPTVAPASKPVQAPVQKGVKAEEKPAAKVQAKAPAVPAPPPAKAQKEIKTKPAAVAAGKVDNKVKPAVAGKGTATKGRYTLLAGEFASDRETEKVRLKLVKQGITDVSVRKIKKDETMHRLFLADFDSHEAAAAELRKLQPETGSAFILNEKGRYALYAGSYLHERGAAAEQKRLAGKGVKLTLKSVMVALPISEVTAGSYPAIEDAQKEATRLKKKGIVVRVIKSGQ